MKTIRHGLSIGIHRVGDQFFLTLKATGKLTHRDYEVITPVIDSALQGVSAPRINALIDGTELEGWELRAAWDDFRLGLKHGKQFEKIAIFGNKNWQQLAAKVGSWFISGEVKYFEDELSALDWLHA
ncbi:STAS/SEC14 domain-containing protein [Coraliomargarita parva]|uniref:STAS/SEC14 domain-containing protein n=1 Tax=Coraliomargarita parva TaxID=3014050 RepID=UPI0022B5C723|nr:STAS/SEC14 domain-containing protein [Coraliomargarita parva]